MRLIRQSLISLLKAVQFFCRNKEAAQDAIATEAERCGMFYVNERWLGGMLTNFKTIQSRIARLKEIETMRKMEHLMFFLKEVINLKKELEKLQKNLGGIKEMKRLPDAIFIVDPKEGKNLCSGSTCTWYQVNRYCRYKL